MKDFSDVYDKAGRQLFNAYREAFQTMTPSQTREQPEPPPIDALWQNTNVGQVQELANRVGPQMVGEWLKYMREKGGGRW